MSMHCNICGSENISEKYSLTEFDVFQCQKCSLVFLSQIPSEETLKDFYCSDYYMERKEYYFNNSITNPQSGKQNANIDAFSEGLKKLNSLKPNKGQLMDIGCGMGVFLHMAKMDGWDCCGIDVSPYAAKYVKDNFGLKVYNSGDLKQAALPSDTFDLITMWDSLEHLPDPLGQLKEIRRILKDDGLIMLNIPNEKALLRMIAEYLYIITAGKFTYPVRKLYHIYHIYYYGFTALKTLLRMGDFEIVSLEENSIPIVKARGSSLEKSVVKLVSYLEKALGMEYELLIVAKAAAKTHCRES